MLGLRFSLPAGRALSRIVDEPWTPPLHLTEVGNRCRLSLSGCAYGHGETLQEAADDLVHKVLALVAQLRGGRFVRASTDMPPMDPRIAGLIHELAGIVESGGDVRQRLFGH
jgi:hypothetical protein